MTKSRPLPRLERLQELFEYQPETGWLTWKTSPPHSRVKAGSRAGSAAGCGYRQVSIDRTKYLEHRLTWLLCHGEDPGDLHVDHINGKKTDNRIANLRLATKAENERNQVRLRSTNTSGAAGGHWNERVRKWQAHVRLGGRSKHLGYFDSLEAGAAARRIAELEHYREFAPRQAAALAPGGNPMREP